MTMDESQRRYRYWLGRTYRALSGHPKGLTVRQVAHRLDIDERVACHLLHVLETSGYIDKVALTPNVRWANGEAKPNFTRTTKSRQGDTHT